MTLNVRVSNIQYSRKLNFDKTTLVNTFLPLLQNTSTINQIFITQELKVPSPMTLDTINALQNLTYLTFTLKLIKNKAAIKLQLSKEKMETHLTLISTIFYKDAQDLITFLDNKQLGNTSQNYNIKCCGIKKTTKNEFLSSIKHDYYVMVAKKNLP